MGKLVVGNQGLDWKWAGGRTDLEVGLLAGGLWVVLLMGGTRRSNKNLLDYSVAAINSI
jgi:hypothetical protein